MGGALTKAQAAFVVPGGTGFAILGRDLLSWSISHPQHAGVVLNVRVIDGANAGKTGYVLASWLSFTVAKPGGISHQTSQADDPNKPRFDLSGLDNGSSGGQPHVRIISRRPVGLTEDDGEAIIGAARQAIMEAHTGTEVGDHDIRIEEAAQQNAYDIWLPVYKSLPQGHRPDGLTIFDQPAKCTVRRVGEKWTADLVYFPTREKIR